MRRTSLDGWGIAAALLAQLIAFVITQSWFVCLSGSDGGRVLDPRARDRCDPALARRPRRRSAEARLEQADVRFGGRAADAGRGRGARAVREVERGRQGRRARA